MWRGRLARPRHRAHSPLAGLTIWGTDRKLRVRIRQHAWALVVLTQELAVCAREVVNSLGWGRRWSVTHAPASISNCRMAWCTEPMS